MNTDGHKICELKKAEQRNAQFREMLAEQTIKNIVRCPSWGALHSFRTSFINAKLV